ncbi:glycoside hydrolase family 38 protein [Suillus brevipes Sb2]|nr:glycoside hydrolase family 38 protein [Suillus brevipes Sb2]
MLQAENTCVEEEARLEVGAARAREEEIRRKEEERKQWEVFHSVEDLTHEVQGRSSYPIASGGFGDIWRCVLVKPSSAIQVAVAVKTIRVFEADDKDTVRKKLKRVHRCSLDRLVTSLDGKHGYALMHSVGSKVASQPVGMFSVCMPASVFTNGTDHFVLRNANARLTISEGRISSLIDVRLGRELIPKGSSGGLVVFEDRPNYWDAWGPSFH